jgi:tRNA pseudouridine38-40 synthase
MRAALLLAYDGRAFAGWWRQPGRRTVAGELDAAFARLGEPAAAPVGASRTDAGVHARGQLAHADLARVWDPAELARRLDAQLPPDLACHAVAAVDPAWHAAHGVRRKTYRYLVDAAPRRDPFAAGTAWRVPGALDEDLLHRAAALAAGDRDWAAFVRRGEHRSDTRCRLIACRWRRRNGLLACDLAADGFIYRLARSLVGGMVLVARGGCPLDAWQEALHGRSTPAATQQAPAHGLCLERVVHRRPPRWHWRSA